MSQDLHVSPDLFKRQLINSKGDKANILAAWLELGSATSRPVFTLMVVNNQGSIFKVHLPDTDWEFTFP
jgi:hypothetical protein